MKSSNLYLDTLSISHILEAILSSWSHGKYKPSTSPPHALNDQSIPRIAPLSFTTKVAPQSRIHESSLLISTTRMLFPLAKLRTLLYWFLETTTVIGSYLAIFLITSKNTFWAGFPPNLQLSGRSGQMIYVPLWGSNSPGILNPSFLGVESNLFIPFSPFYVFIFYLL